MPDRPHTLLRTALLRTMREPRLSLERRVRNAIARACRSQRGYENATDKERFITEIIDDLAASELLEHISDALYDLLQQRRL